MKDRTPRYTVEDTNEESEADLSARLLEEVSEGGARAIPAEDGLTSVGMVEGI